MRKLLIVAAVIPAAVFILLFRVALLALGAVVYAYLFPWVVAQKRGHPRQKEILLVCALSAWLVIPWIGALWVARTNDRAAPGHADMVFAWNAFDD